MTVNHMKLRKVVNASGRMSILGVSTLSQDVTSAMKRGGEQYFVMDELHDEAGKFAAEVFGTEAALITNSASAAMSLAVAGCIAKQDTYVQRHIHDDSLDVDREVVIMKGHNVNYGAPVETMIQLGGGDVREAGYANGSSQADLEAAITDRTVAFLYVKSHHCVQKNMPTLAEVSKVCDAHGVPLIIDAAAEEGLDQYGSFGEIVIFSGSKAIEGPTSGILAGKKQYVDDARAHNTGIGRAMKIGKEAIIGFIQALESFGENTLTKQEQLDILAELQPLDRLPGVGVSIVQDEAGRNIFRGRITIDDEESRLSAIELVHLLKDGDPAIFTRDYNANIGYFEIDPRPLLPGDIELIVTQITDMLGES